MSREGSFNWFKKNKIDEVEKTKKISSSGDGLNVDAHHLAGDKAELHPYKHTDKPVFSEKGDIVSTYKGTDNPEGEMIDEEEVNSVDQYAKYNNDPKEIKAGNNLYKKEIGDAGYEDWHADEVYWHGIKEGANDKNIAGTEEVEEKQVNKSHDVNFKTPRELSVENKARIGDDKDLNYKKYKTSVHHFGRKPRYKDKKTEDREIFGK
jgi:hypothetical protein